MPRICSSPQSLHCVRKGLQKLRRQWPWVYETWADLKMETWTKIKIEVKGRSAKLFLNGSEQPSLVVDGRTLMRDGALV